MTTCVHIYMLAARSVTLLSVESDIHSDSEVEVKVSCWIACSLYIALRPDG
jgi:hypothetical protein